MLNNIHTLNSNAGYKNTSEINSNHKNDVTTNEFIEIPTNIKDFYQLVVHEFFSVIKVQYIQNINKLSELYYHFTGVNVGSLSLITDDLEQYPDTELKSLRVFYSYKIIRKHLYNIVSYLSECKNNHISNNKTAIICARLEDCFGMCVDGFNTKILRIGEHLFLNDQLHNKINIQIKKNIEDTINNLLIKYHKFVNIHEENALFNIVASDFNFKYIYDPEATLGYFSDNLVQKVLCELDIALSEFNICKIIVEELYNFFNDIITNTSKSDWVNNYIEDITGEAVAYLESHFIDVVNQYFNIALQKDKLTINDILDITDNDKTYVTNIKNKLHLLCAKYINKTDNCYAKLLRSNKNIIYNTDNILSIKNKYFFILDDKNRIIPLQLSHLKTINLENIDFKIYIPILIQALEQTFSTKDIYVFLRNFNTQILLFYSEYSYMIIQELNNYLKKNMNVRNRILQSLLEAKVQHCNQVDRICNNFIKNNILINDLLKCFLINKVDISPYLNIISKKYIFYFIVSLEIDNLEAFFLNKNLYKSYGINKVRSTLFYLFIAKRWSFILKLLNSKIKFFFMDSLSNRQKKKILKLTLDDNQYNVAEYFLLDYLELKITDSQKNNIIHYAILNDNLLLLQHITKKTTENILHKLLSGKNNLGLTPLMMTMMLAKSIEYFYALLHCCNYNIINITNNGNNIIMLAAQEGYYSVIQKLINKSIKPEILQQTNKNGDNALMLAIKSQSDNCTKIILDNIEHINLKQTEHTYGYTAIHLAILYKSSWIKQLVNKVDESTLRILSYSNDSILSIATKENNQFAIDLILKRCKSLLSIKNDEGLNPLMIAASKGYFICLQQLFNYSSKHLLQVDKYNNNILMLATQNGHAKCVNFLLKNCSQEILKKLYKQINTYSYDVLCLAKYFNDTNKNNPEYKSILATLIKYKPN